MSYHKIIHPQPPPSFVGREKEIAKLTKAIEKYNVIYIVGIAGIGKTSLASQFANELSTKDHSHIIWLNCFDQWDSDSIIYHTLLILNDLFPKRYIPPHKFFSQMTSTNTHISFTPLAHQSLTPNQTERIMNFISLLNDSNLVIFIDDFEKVSDEGANFFLNTISTYLKNAKIIIMSRKMPNIDPLRMLDIFLLNLGFLSLEDSKRLMDFIATSTSLPKFTDSLKEKIYTSTDGHPLLLKKLISNLLIEKDVLGGFQCRFTSEFVDKEIFKNLTDKHRKILFLLSVSRKPLSLQQIKDILHIKNIEEPIKLLKSRLIVEQQAKGYFIHHLFKRIILENTPESLKKEFHFKLAKYIIDTKANTDIEGLKEAFWHFVKSENISDATVIFNQLFHLMKKYCQLHELDNILKPIMRNIPTPPANILLASAEIQLLKGELNKSLFDLNRIEENLPPLLKMRKYMLQAQVKMHLRDIQGALQSSKKAAKIAKKEGAESQKIDIYTIQSDIYLDIENNKKAKSMLKKALKVLKDVNFPIKKAHVLRRMGIILYREGKLSKAISTFKKSLSLFSEEEAPRLSAYINGELGITYSLAENYSMAIQHFEKALNFAEHNGDIRCKAATLCNLGLSYFLSGRWQDGLQRLEEGVKMYRQWNYRKKYVISAIHLSILYETGNMWYDALSLLIDALDVAKEIQTKRLEIAIRLNLAEIYLSTEEIEESYKQIHYTEPLLKKLAKYEVEEAFYIYNMLLSEIYYRKGDLEKFKQYANKFYQRKDTISKRNKLLGEFLLAVTEFDKALNLNKANILSQIEKLSAYDRLIITPSVKRIEKIGKTSKKLFVLTKDGCMDMNPQQVKNVRKNKHKYDLWIDADKGVFIEKNKGEIDIGSRRVLLPLLIFFMKNAGTPLSASKIYSHIWEGEYHKHLNYNTLRSAISRLRKIIEPNPQSPKYIITKKNWENSEALWMFNAASNFCLISSKK